MRSLTLIGRNTLTKLIFITKNTKQVVEEQSRTYDLPLSPRRGRGLRGLLVRADVHELRHERGLPHAGHATVARLVLSRRGRLVGERVLSFDDFLLEFWSLRNTRECLK